MKKILMIIPQFGLGGAETMCENLICSFDKKKYELLVISLYDEKTAITNRIDKKGVKIIYLNKHKGLDLSMIPKIKKIINNFHPDVIHTHRYVLEYVVPAIKISKYKNTKIVHTIHNIASKEVGKYLQIMQKRWFKKGIVTPIAISELVRDSIEARYGIKHIPVIYNGIDLNKCIVKKNYKFNNKILHIGRFFEQKNHSEMIEIFENCLNTNKTLKLYLVGNGELLEETKELVKKKKIEKNVIFLGTMDECYKMMNETDIFILPSKWEGMPMTIIEAMGSGIPCVAYPVGGIPNMIQDGINGYLPKTKEEFTADILNLCSNERLRANIGQEALKTSKIFSAKVMCDKYCKIYFENVDKKGK